MHDLRGSPPSSVAPLRTLLSFGVAGEQLRLLRSLGIRPPPSCPRPALPHLPQEGSAGQGLAVPPVSPPSLPWSPTCRRPPAKRPAGRCGQMLPRLLAGGAAATPEVSGPQRRGWAGARARGAGGRWRRAGGRAGRRERSRGGAGWPERGSLATPGERAAGSRALPGRRARP